MTDLFYCSGGKARNQGSRRGAALIIVLTFVVLLTILVVAFLNHSQTSVQIMNARAAEAQVDIMSRTALQLTKGDLRQEIIAGSTNNAAVYGLYGQTVYVPSANLMLVPSRTGFTPGTAGSDPADNIVKISKSGVSFFSSSTGTFNPSIPSPAYASSVSTSTPSLNGRYINGWTTSGWNKPGLVDTTRFSTTSLPVPDWIYLVTNSPGRQVLSAPVSGVIGRYAYVIYDEGGLLDANVAGYPSSLSSADKRDLYRKGPLAMADLSQIPPAGGISADKLVAWRNAASSASGAFAGTNYPSSTAPDYLKYLFNGSLNRGFVGVYPGDQKFLSRQDMIAFSAANPSILPAESLAYLGTFSRGLDAPTWTPVTPAGSSFDYASKSEFGGSNPWPYNVDSANCRWPATFTVTRPKLDADVDATGTLVPTETITFTQGQPVLTHRFPLSKIALLSNPNALIQSPATVGSIAWAVNYYFGLNWVATDGQLAEPHWEYAHTVAGATLGNGLEINALADVAKLKREPDMFEMLRQGILRGSAEDIMVLDMGASIIDQFDADDVPTAITTGTPREAFGKENLPLFSQMLLWPYRPKSDTTRTTFEAYFVPMFWNPHRNASTLSGSVTSFRAILTPGTGSNLPVINIKGTGATIALGYANSYNTSGMTATGTLTFSTSSSTTYQEPTILSGGVASPTPPSSPAPGISEVTDRSGFYLGSISAPDKQSTIAAGGSGTGMANLTTATVTSFGGNNVSAGLNLTMQCLSNGTWSTYENVGINYAILGSVYMNTVDSAGAKGVNASPSFSNANALSYYGSQSSGPVDPRITGGAFSGSSGGIAGTEVFSTSIGSPLPSGATWQPIAPESVGNGFIGLHKVSSQFGVFPQVANSSILTVPSPNNFYLGMWNENKAVSTYPYYLDYDTIATGVTGDQILRPGDGSYGANPMAANNINDRPIILNRPFRSVGELGYAFRGVEWRTIDFCSSFSADSGLLDMFSVDESNKITQTSAGAVPNVPINAGVLNINTRHPEVLAALMNGSLKNDLDTTASSVISSTQASAIASDIVGETANLTAGHGPLINRSDLVNRIMGITDISQTQLSGTVSKPEREAVVRALADSADTRTWNLLIDLDVQIGHYPPNAIQTGTAAALAQFDVEGEHRYWLHVAIDRYTGQVIDEQLEVVNNN